MVRIAVLPFETAGLGPEKPPRSTDYSMNCSPGWREWARSNPGDRAALRRAGHRERRTLKESASAWMSGTPRKARPAGKAANYGWRCDSPRPMRRAVWSETFAQDAGADFEETVVARVSGRCCRACFRTPRRRRRRGLAAKGGSHTGREDCWRCGDHQWTGAQHRCSSEAPVRPAGRISEAMVRLARMDSRYREYGNQARKAAREAGAWTVG